MKQAISNKAVIWEVLGLVKEHSSGRWDYVNGVTDPLAVKYLQEGGYRRPSRAYPMSYFTALLSYKFAKYLLENDALLAESCGLIKKELSA